MNRALRLGIVAGLVVTFSLSAAARGLSGERAGPSSGPSPQTEPAFKPGDVIAVAPQHANLMRGADVVAVVPGGERIVVVEVRDQWIGTYVVRNGQKKAGWLRATDFIPADDSAKPQEGQVCLCAMPTTTAAAPNPPAATCPVRTGPAERYFRDYYTGYYGRHETDPDIHVWEPWMH